MDHNLKAIEDALRTLGLEPGVDYDAVQRAWKKFNRELHPDRHDDPLKVLKLKNINAAHDVIKRDTKALSLLTISQQEAEGNTRSGSQTSSPQRKKETPSSSRYEKLDSIIAPTDMGVIDAIWRASKDNKAHTFIVEDSLIPQDSKQSRVK